MAEIAAGVAALERRDWTAALDELLAVWATNRAPELAHVIELIDRCALGWAVPAEPEAAQLRDADVVERGRCLRALAGSYDDLADPAAWIDALLALPPDPRVSAVLADLSHRLPLAQLPWDDDGLGDPELDLDDPLTARWREVCRRHFDWRVDGNTQHGEPPLEPAVHDKLVASARKRLVAAELLLRRWLFDAPTDAEVAAAFAADPADAGGRGVYSDWLQQRGDPRGAWLAGGSLDSHVFWRLEPLWLGPLGRTAHARFEHGRVTEVRFDERPKSGVDWAALEVGWRPGWAAVERLSGPSVELLSQVALPRVRRLSVERATLEAALPAVRLPALAILELSAWYARLPPTEREIAGVQDVLRGLPSVRALRLHWYADTRDDAALAAGLAPLLSEPCVRELAIHGSCREWLWVPAPAFLRQLRAVASPLRVFRGLGDAGEHWTFGHTGDAIDWARARVEWWGTPNEHTVARAAELVAVGIPALEIVTKEPLAPGIAAAVARLRCEVRSTIDPALSSEM